MEKNKLPHPDDLPDVQCSMAFNRGAVEDFVNRPASREGFTCAVAAELPRIPVRIDNKKLRRAISTICVFAVALYEEKDARFRLVHVTTLS